MIITTRHHPISSNLSATPSSGTLALTRRTLLNSINPLIAIFSP